MDLNQFKVSANSLPQFEEIDEGERARRIKETSGTFTFKLEVSPEGRERLDKLTQMLREEAREQYFKWVCGEYKVPFRWPKANPNDLNLSLLGLLS